MLASLPPFGPRCAPTEPKPRSQCVALNKICKNNFNVCLLKIESFLVNNIDQQMAATPTSNGEFCFGPPPIGIFTCTQYENICNEESNTT